MHGNLMLSVYRRIQIDGCSLSSKKPFVVTIGEMGQGGIGQLYSTFILPHDVSSQQDKQRYHCLKRQSVFITTL